MNRIAVLRKERKLSQKELGMIIGVAQNTICNWENGKREPDYDSLKKMAFFFNCSTDYLLGRTAFGKNFVFDEQTDLNLDWAGHSRVDAQEKKPAPTNGSRHSETAERFMDLVDKLTPNQQQLLLAQLQAWTEQNQRQALAGQATDD